MLIVFGLHVREPMCVCLHMYGGMSPLPPSLPLCKIMILQAIRPAIAVKSLPSISVFLV